MRIKRIIGIILIVTFVGIQFIPTELNQSDVSSGLDFINFYDVPQDISTTLKVSCYDCHSNNTQYPWYNRIQPVALFLKHHIEEGKSKLDFSIYSEYSKRRRKSKLKSIISQIKDDEMPMTSYTFLHKETALSESEKKMVLVWLNRLRDSIVKK